MEVKQKEEKNNFHIQSVFAENGRTIESVVEDAFIKYLKYTEYVENK